MHTLLLRLSGPMQSWGIQSHFSVRDTGLEPSKSGVIGLLCAAMGVLREDEATLRQLASLRMGVRVDREGILRVDYHTAKDVLKASGGIKETEPSHRYYLADAIFLVGLECADNDIAILERAQTALQHPVWPLFLGRKAFVPSEPIALPDGLRRGEQLEEALANYPCLNRRNPPSRLRIVLEDEQGMIVRRDQPLSFVQGRRRFGLRRLSITFVPRPTEATEV